MSVVWDGIVGLQVLNDIKVAVRGRLADSAKRYD